MSKVYGGRWRIQRQIGQGGQAHVFLVEDLQDPTAAPVVLKRILNSKRYDRFVREVDACRRLAHAGIIRLLDHSALVANVGDDEKMFLVMPYLSGGSMDKRVQLYKGALDTVLEVGLLLSNALAHAHSLGVIHRDIKPENVLFDGQDNNAVISDFGICLLRDLPRATGEDEVVGPRAFIAPELEDGGKLDATPAADIYSLGKVLYYMLSGGTILPRERHREAKFDIASGRGIRHELFGRLLDGMICELPKRLLSMDDVQAELRRIQQWDQQVSKSLSAGTQAAVDRFLKSGADALDVRKHNEAVLAAQQNMLSRYTEGVLRWLNEQLDSTAAMLTHAEISECSILDQAELARLDCRRERLEFSKREHIYGEPLAVRGISFVQASDPFKKRNLLLFRVVTLRKVIVTFGNARQKLEASDPSVVFVPQYYQSDTWEAFFAESPPPAGRGRSNGRVLNGLLVRELAQASLVHKTTIQRWPADLAEYKRVFDRALEIFLDRMESWARSSGHALE